MRVPSRSYRAGLAVVLLGALLAACSSNLNTTPITPALPTSATVATGPFAATSVPQIGIGGITVLAAIPTTNVIANVTATVSIEPFTEAGALNVARTSTQASRTPQLAGATNDIYLRFTSDTAMTIAGTPGISFTLPSIAAGASYYLALHQTTGWLAPAQGPGVVNGTSVSFAINTMNAVPISPNAPIIVALYSVANTNPSPSPSASAAPAPSASAAPTASPSASPAPTPSPIPTPVFAPSALAFDASNPSTQSFTVTETGNTAAIAAAIACTAGTSTPIPAPAPTPAAAFIAQLNATSALPVAGVATFSVTSGDFPGTCTITATDARSATARGSVSVSASTISVFSHGRNAR